MHVEHGGLPHGVERRLRDDTGFGKANANLLAAIDSATDRLRREANTCRETVPAIKARGVVELTATPANVDNVLTIPVNGTTRFVAAART